MVKMTEREAEIKRKLREQYFDRSIPIAENIAKDKEELDQMQRELEEKYGEGSAQTNIAAQLLEYRVHNLFMGKQFIRVEVHPYSRLAPILIYYPTDTGGDPIARFWSPWEFVWHWVNNSFKRVKDYVHLPFDEPRQFQPILLEDFSLAFIDGFVEGLPGDVEIYAEDDAVIYGRDRLENFRLANFWEITNPEVMKDEKKADEAMDGFKEDMEELFGEGVCNKVHEKRNPIAVFSEWYYFLQHYKIWSDDQIFNPIAGEIVDTEPRNPKWMIPHARCWWKYRDKIEVMTPGEEYPLWKETPFESFEELRVKYIKVTKEELLPFIEALDELETANRMTDAEMRKKFGDDWKKWRAPSQEEEEKEFRELEEEDRREGGA